MKKWHLDRRTFLKGIGYSLALPALDVMILNKKAYAASNTPHFIFDFFPNGFYAENDNNFIPTHMIDELKILGDNYSYFAKLDNPFRHKPLAYPHLENFLSFTRGQPFRLTGYEKNRPSDQHAAFTKTFDQYLVDAQPEAKNAPIRSFNINMQMHNNRGLVFRVFSWQGPGKPIPYYFNPKDLYDKLFSFDKDNKPSTPNHGIISVLDVVKDGILSLNRRVSSADKLKLDQYFTSIREVEKNIKKIDQFTAQCSLDTNLNKDLDGYVASTYKQRLDIMQELKILAHECELTYNSSIMRAYPASTLENSWISDIEGNKNWHGLSHYNTAKHDDGETYQGNSSDLALNARSFKQVNSWHTKNFAEFALKMDARKDPTGKSLLDKTLLVHGSCQSKGPWHMPENLFFALAGGANGRIKTGIKSTTKQPLTNLWLTIMKRYGVNIAKYGDSTGEIATL